MKLLTFKELLEEIERGTQPEAVDFFDEVYFWNKEKNTYFDRHGKRLLKAVSIYMRDKGLVVNKMFEVIR